MMSMLQFSPGGFKAKTAEPEATLEIFDKYVIQMQRVFRLNRRTNPVTGDRDDFTDAEKKDIMLLEGGVDMEDLSKHVGKVQEGDTYMRRQLIESRKCLETEGVTQQQSTNCSVGALNVPLVLTSGIGGCMRVQKR